jgi:hypothetical protein
VTIFQARQSCSSEIAPVFISHLFVNDLFSESDKFRVYNRGQVRELHQGAWHLAVLRGMFKIFEGDKYNEKTVIYRFGCSNPDDVRCVRTGGPTRPSSGFGHIHGNGVRRQPSDFARRPPYPVHPKLGRQNERPEAEQPLDRRPRRPESPGIDSRRLEGFRAGLVSGRKKNRLPVRSG